MLAAPVMRLFLADGRMRLDLVDEIERADRYNVRVPAGMRAGKSRGGQFRALSEAVAGALEAWINGEGDDDPLERFTTAQLRKAAAQLGVQVPASATRPRVKLALLEKARGDMRAQRAEADAARQAMPEGYRVERLESGRLSVQREGEPGFAEAGTVEEARRLAVADRERRAAAATRRRVGQSRLPGGPTPPPRPAVAPMTAAGKTPRKLTDAEKVADALAAGKFPEWVAVELLTGRREPEGYDAAAVRAFTAGMVHAGYITELAWSGDRERLEGWLRAQNTSTLRMAAPFFGLSLPADAGHEAVAAALAGRAMQLEAPRRDLPSAEELRQSLMSRKVKDLQASLRAAGLPTSGRKAELVDRLVAAYSAVRGDDGDAVDGPDRGAGSAGRGDGRGRSRGAAGAQPAGGEPDAPAAGHARDRVGSGTGAVAPAKKATPAKRTPSLPSRPGRVSVADSRDWSPAQHVAHAEQARQRGDLAEARLHRGLADAKNRQIVEGGRGLEHLRSLTDRDDARRFLRSLTREQLNTLARQLGVDVDGSRDAVIARILTELFGG